jgi:hypothetical protein
MPWRSCGNLWLGSPNVCREEDNKSFQFNSPSLSLHFVLSTYSLVVGRYMSTRMEIFKATALKFCSFLTTQLPCSSSSFPQFANLPIELRLQIWELSLESRIVPAHLHVDFLDDGPDTNADQSTPIEGDEDDDDMEALKLWHQTMAISAITACTEGGKWPCKCRYDPPHSPHAMPPPALFSVCCESRDATIAYYAKYFEKEYTTRCGLPTIPSVSLATGEVAERGRGVLFNPKVDTLLYGVTWPVGKVFRNCMPLLLSR